MVAEERERRDREFAEQREHLDQQSEDDRRRYEEESERRMQEMQKQMELLQALVSGHSAPARSPWETETVKLTRFSESDDIEAYLTTFGRMMGAYEIAKERWPFNLAPQLTGKAQ